MSLRKYIFILFVIMGIAHAASQRKVIGNGLDPSDVSAINTNFKNINNELSNTVHKTMTETISGDKTFSGSLRAGSGFTVNQTSGTANIPFTFGGPKPWIDPTASRYGATPNDNSDDDSTAIRSALNDIYLNYGGGTVQLPCGTYDIGTSTTLVINSNTTLHGEQYGCVVIKAKTSLNERLLQNQARTQHLGVSTDTHILIENIIFDLNGSNQSDSTAVTFIRIKDCIFRNVEFNSPYDSLFLLAGANDVNDNENVYFENVFFDGNGQSQAVDLVDIGNGKNIIMDKCHAKGAKEHGGQPMFSIAAINNFVVRDCYFDGDADGDGDGDGSPISMFGVNGGGIFGSEILNSAEAGIRYQAWREGSPDKEFENFTISGNNIHDNAWYGIWARQDTAPADTPFNVCIVNNSIWGSGRNGLKIEVANGLDISGNYIHTNSTSNAGSYAAIELESATDVDAVFDVSVFNNRMYDNGSTQTLGFRIDAAQNIYIGHNTLEDITTVSTITADTANINFAGKTFSSYSDTAFYSGTLERDVSVGSGDVSYTGIGFKPRAIIFYATVASTNTASWGMSAGASNNVMTQMASGSFDYYTGSASIAYVSGLNTHIGTIKTFDSDGFTITWTKANSPTGTLRVYYMAYR